MSKDKSTCETCEFYDTAVNLDMKWGMCELRGWSSDSLKVLVKGPDYSCRDYSEKGGTDDNIIDDGHKGTRYR